jgi:hypothetical protein
MGSLDILPNQICSMGQLNIFLPTQFYFFVTSPPPLLSLSITFDF